MSTSFEVTPKHRSIFSMAWLANCNAGKTDTTENLQTDAENSLTGSSGAFTNSDLRNMWGAFNPQVVWGPVAYTKNDDGTNDNVTDNLMFVAKGRDQMAEDPSTAVLYVVGVAGTNPISTYGWFAEDFAVNSPVDWSACAGAQIANGSQAGLDVLNSKMTWNNQTIVQFLNSEFEKYDAANSYEVAVAGHSLGGALAPVLALYLKESQTNWNNGHAGISVTTWPFAGPTIGNAAFAGYLTDTLDGYNSVLNAIDIVPHGWAHNDLVQIPSLYTNTNVKIYPGTGDGNPLPTNCIVAGIATWAEGQPPTPDFYVRSAPDQSFTGAGSYIDLKEITELGVGTQTIMKGKGTTGTPYAMLDMIYDVMTGTSDGLTYDQVFAFLVFLSEAGYQHTRGYLLEFFDANTVAAIGKYTALSLSKTGKSYALDASNQVLVDTYNYVTNHASSVTKCTGS